jgi:hypothetical protein
MQRHIAHHRKLAPESVEVSQSSTNVTDLAGGDVRFAPKAYPMSGRDVFRSAFSLIRSILQAPPHSKSNRSGKKVPQNQA